MVRKPNGNERLACDLIRNDPTFRRICKFYVNRRPTKDAAARAAQSTLAANDHFFSVTAIRLAMRTL